MPDQLDELKRQRALVAEHLAWLDRQIAAASPAQKERPQGIEAEPAADAPQATAASAGSGETDALFAQFAAEERPALQPPSKFGCWLGFSIMLLLAVGGAVVLIYSAYR